jgi:hypothetical protein
VEFLVIRSRAELAFDALRDSLELGTEMHARVAFTAVSFALRIFAVECIEGVCSVHELVDVLEQDEPLAVTPVCVCEKAVHVWKIGVFHGKIAESARFKMFECVDATGRPNFSEFVRLVPDLVEGVLADFPTDCTFRDFPLGGVACVVAVE